MIIHKSTYNKILSHFYSLHNEQGGIIGIRSGVVCEYEHDIQEDYIEDVSYVPNITFLNRKINEWYIKDIEFAGIVHNHPDGHDTLSFGDINYAKLLLDCNSELGSLYFPIICNNQIVAYRIEKSEHRLNVILDEVKIVDSVD